MKSVLQSEKECYVCGTTYNLHDHHIIYGFANRKLSEKYGLKVWLCAYHHNMSNQGVHMNKELDLHLKKKHKNILKNTTEPAKNLWKFSGGTICRKETK